MSLFEEKTNVTSEDLESESAFDEIYDDEPLCVRHSTSYSIKKPNNSKLSARQTIDTVAVDRAIARALKSRPKTFEFRHKHLKYLPPSISHLSVCSNLREFDISSNELQSLPDEIAQITSIESINLGMLKIEKKLRIDLSNICFFFKEIIFSMNFRIFWVPCRI